MLSVNTCLALSRNSEKYFTCKDLWRLNNVWTLFWGNWPSSNDTDARRNWSLAFVGVWDERLGTESQLPRYIKCDIHINGLLELLNWYHSILLIHLYILTFKILIWISWTRPPFFKLIWHAIASFVVFM